MLNDTALPVQGQPAPEAGGHQNAAATDSNLTSHDADGAGQAGDSGDEADKSEKKAEKTAEQREIERLRRGIDRKTRQLAEARAHLGAARQVQPQRQAADDNEPLTLSRAELQQMVTDEAQRLAPTLRSQQAETERRQGVIQSLAKSWGQERFDQVASDLDEAFDGLADSNGRPKPAIEAVFESDNPARVIEYLADPENADEAERIARMSAAQAGRAIARLEDKLSAQAAKDKPQHSKAKPPIEPIRGQGGVATAPDPSDTKAWIRWRNEQERKGR